MTKDEALDLALEALKKNHYYMIDAGLPNQSMLNEGFAAITAIKQARSAPTVQEPVWCGHCNGSGRMARDPDIGTDQECFVCDGAGVPAAPVQPIIGSYLEKDNSQFKFSEYESDGVHHNKPAVPAPVQPSHEALMAGYKVACAFGVYESQAFNLAEKMFAAMKSAAPKSEKKHD